MMDFRPFTLDDAVVIASAALSYAADEAVRIEDGLGFQLVPWQPVLEKRIGQHLSGVRRDDGGIEWGFGRQRGLGL